MLLHSIIPEADDLQQHPRLPRWFSRVLALGLLALVISEAGFIGQVTDRARWLTVLGVALFAGEQVVNLMRSSKPSAYAKRWAFHLLVAGLNGALILVAMLQPSLSREGKLPMLLFGFIQGSMLLALGLRALRHQAQLTRLNIRPGWLFMGSFALIVGIGTLLLKLPRAVESGCELTWIDALFTSTSAVCVTGLAVVNTADFFSPTGQVILLALIQVGGLGIMTLTFYLSTVLFRGMSLHDRQVLGELISEKHLAQVAGTVRFIVLFTLIVEAFGAWLLFHALPEDRGTAERVFQAVFHSVSAFCNAGFSTLPNGLADAWIRERVPLQLILCVLIVLGGLGAVVVRDVLAWSRAGLRRLRDPAQLRPRLRVHSRLVLWTTLLLVVAGTVVLWTCEFVLHRGESNGGQLLTAFFHSVTARTAGFNTVDTGAIGAVSLHVLVLLMLIGGSPGGTAGGVRTSVFAVALLHLWNLLRGVSSLVLFRRRLPESLGPRSLAILVLTAGWLFVNFVVLRQLQPEGVESRLIFELVSAFATVGLSMNLTPELTEGAKYLLVLNMFVGRIGLFTVAGTLVPLSRRRPVQRPEEDIILA